MKKILLIALSIITVCVFVFTTPSADAAKKGGKKSSISKEEMQNIVTSVDNFTRKVYANSLFSPKDMEELIQIKLKLDDQMLASPDPEYAPLYFKIGNIYKARENKEDAIDCYQTIMENFSDTALYPKAKKKLEDLGVEIKSTASAQLDLPEE